MLDSTVAATALLYAAPVLIVGLATRRGWLVVLTALAVAGLGLLVGDPRYLLADLAAVLIVLLIALLPGRRRVRPRTGARSAGARASASGTRRRSRVWDVLGAALVAWILFQTWKVDDPVPGPTPGTKAGPLQGGGPGSADRFSGQPRGAAGAGMSGASPATRERDLRHCLELDSAEAIRACAERR